MAKKSQTPQEDPSPEPTFPVSVPQPNPVGRDHVLVGLKRRLGMVDRDAEDTSEVETIGPDLFPLRVDSPLREQHQVLTECLGAWRRARERYAAIHEEKRDDRSWDFKASWQECETTRDREIESLLIGDMEKRSALVLAGCERDLHRYLTWNHELIENDELFQYWVGEAVEKVAEKLTAAQFVGNRDDDFDYLCYCSAVAGYSYPVTRAMVELAERRAAEGELTGGERHVIHRLRCASAVEPPMGSPPEVPARLTRLLDGDATLLLVPGEHWADTVHADLMTMKPGPRMAWVELFRYALTAESAKPKAAWTKGVKPLVEAVKAGSFRSQLAGWLASVAKGRSVYFLGAFPDDKRGAGDMFNEGNATVLRGLVWMLVTAPDKSSPRLVSDLLLTCIKKVAGVGPRCVKVANACVWALGEMAASKQDDIREAALGQLARLKARVTFKTTLKAIEKAFDKAADAAGMSRDDLEELGVPDFGFENGVLQAKLGEASVELRVEANKVVTKWTNEKGKVVKSPPAMIKRDFKEEVKELKQFAKDAEGILLAGRARLDTIYLADKAWPLEDWRERYLDHGLLGTIAQRLIWLVDETPAMFVEGEPIGVDGGKVDCEPASAVRLWHPVGRDETEVLGWREFIEDRQITQPFKQAHREVYLLTDAERNTNVYSNRFAAHIIKQHQFNALCGARRWNNKLRLMVDDEYPPASRDLPQWGLRAEFWVEGIGDNYGTDTTESGTYLYLATDQVRFYAIDAATSSAHASGGGYRARAYGPGEGDVNEPIPLDRVPPLVFSEVMRDVDLFVGVASVGNDPNWMDGGRERPHQDYWHRYAFGDLNASAKTRKQILERLIPRLKIADRCSLDNKFLVVRGDVRTYKIHLGSGNILMDPTDEYLCIVPKAASLDSATGKVFLPFEGDRTMAIILSKAFLLADDKKIKDTTILSQIRR